MLILKDIKFTAVRMVAQPGVEYTTGFMIIMVILSGGKLMSSSIYRQMKMNLFVYMVMIVTMMEHPNEVLKFQVRIP